MSKSLFLVHAVSAICLAGTAQSACIVPNTIVNGTVVDSTPVAGNFAAISTCLGGVQPAGTDNSIQLNNGSGSLAAVGPLTNGQLLIGSAGSPPVATALTAGQGITISSGPGSTAISTTGNLGGGGADWLNGAAIVKPSAANFVLQTSTTPPTGAQLADTDRGVVLKTTAAVSSTAMMAEMDAPSGHWQATMLGVYTGGLSNYSLPSIAVRDAANSKSLEFGVGGRQSTYRFDYLILSGGIGLNSRVNDTETQDVGLPQPSQPVWQRLTYDGTNLIWSFSRDGEFFIPAYSVTASSALTNLSKIGPAIAFQGPVTTWPAAFHILSWSVSSL